MMGYYCNSLECGTIVDRHDTYCTECQRLPRCIVCSRYLGAGRICVCQIKIEHINEADMSDGMNDNELGLNRNGTTPDPVDWPPHYNSTKLQPIDAIEGMGLADSFHLANAIKYIARCRHKGNAAQDVKKAIWYLNRFLETL